LDNRSFNIDWLKEIGAYLEGHFVLTSGRHSNVYMEKFRILERPDLVKAACSALLNAIKEYDIDLVAGPTTGGLIVAYEMATQLGVPAIYLERGADNQRELRRGATIATGTRVLVVDDVLTTGLSIKEVKAVTEAYNAQIVAIGVLIDRSNIGLDLGAPIYHACRVEAETFAPDEIPEWLQEIPITKPGTRK
jgi:orotate phosphoribosyltransferase